MRLFLYCYYYSDWLDASPTILGGFCDHSGVKSCVFSRRFLLCFSFSISFGIFEIFQNLCSHTPFIGCLATLPKPGVFSFRSVSRNPWPTSTVRVSKGASFRGRSSSWGFFPPQHPRFCEVPMWTCWNSFSSAKEWHCGVVVKSKNTWLSLSLWSVCGFLVFLNWIFCPKSSICG